MSANSSFDLLIMVARCPHESIATQNDAISISCRLLNRCGIEIGSFAMKNAGVLKRSTSASKCAFKFVWGDIGVKIVVFFSKISDITQ